MDEEDWEDGETCFSTLMLSWPKKVKMAMENDPDLTQLLSVAVVLALYDLNKKLCGRVGVVGGRVGGEVFCLTCSAHLQRHHPSLTYRYMVSTVWMGLNSPRNAWTNFSRWWREASSSSRLCESFLRFLQLLLH
jgi:hypothetical protein